MGLCMPRAAHLQDSLRYIGGAGDGHQSLAQQMLQTSSFGTQIKLAGSQAGLVFKKWVKQAYCLQDSLHYFEGGADDGGHPGMARQIIAHDTYNDCKFTMSIQVR